MPLDKYLPQLTEPVFKTGRTKEISSFNPSIHTARENAKGTKLHVYSYNATSAEHFELRNIMETFTFRDCGKVTWINVDGIYKPDIEVISQHFRIHPLLVEDILSISQRPKMDDIEGVIF